MEGIESYREGTNMCSMRVENKTKRVHSKCNVYKNICQSKNDNICERKEKVFCNGSEPIASLLNLFQR